MSEIKNALKNGTILTEKELYTISKVIDCGGMGITYLGRKNKAGKYEESKVIIKELFIQPKSNDFLYRKEEKKEVFVKEDFKDHFEKFKIRFNNEAKILHSLKGETHTPRVIDFFEQYNTCYFVMDLIPKSEDSQEAAEDLKKWLAKKGSLSIEDTLILLRPIGELLSRIHSKNVEEGGSKFLLHRDIKPSNILIDSNGKPYLIDFGIAKTYDSFTDNSNFTNIHTPGYAPIEQYKGDESKIGPAVDVFAFASTFFYCLTSVDPPTDFGEESIENYNKNLSKAVVKVIDKARAFKQEDRFNDVKSFINELDLALSKKYEGTIPAKEEIDNSPEEEIQKTNIWAYIFIGLAVFAFVLIMYYQKISKKENEMIFTKDYNEWLKALEQDDMNSYNLYNKNNPNGKYIGDSNSKIDSITNKNDENREKQEAVLEDKKGWGNARKINTYKAYKDYLNDFPKGIYVDEANASLKNISEINRKEPKINYAAQIASYEAKSVDYFLNAEYLNAVNSLQKAQNLKYTKERSIKMEKIKRTGAVEGGKIEKRIAKMILTLKIDNCDKRVQNLREDLLKMRENPKERKKYNDCKSL